jgi:hypothetical protein
MPMDLLGLGFQGTTALRVRAICRADDEAAARAAVGRLAPLEGDPPVRAPEGLLYTSCNDGYFERYARDFLRSARLHAPDLYLHVHVFDPSPSTLASLDRAAADSPVSYSFERVARAPEPVRLSDGQYWVCARFVRLWQLMEAVRSPVLAVDVDAAVRNPLAAAIAAHRNADVSIFLRPRFSWYRRVLGAALLVQPSELGRRFLRDCAATFAGLALRPGRETMDQLVLYLVWRWYVRHATGFRQGRLSQSFSDWAYGDESLIWHAKGDRKETLPLERLFAARPDPAAADRV